MHNGVTGLHSALPYIFLSSSIHRLCADMDRDFPERTSEGDMDSTEVRAKGLPAAARHDASACTGIGMSLALTWR